MNTYITNLTNDIDRILALPRISGYEKAIRPWLMKRFKNYLCGNVKCCRKEDQWNALSEIAHLYGMVVKFNDSRLPVVNWQKTPLSLDALNQEE